MRKKDKLGRQAMHLAARAGCNVSLDYLITNFNADVDMCTENSDLTPLHLAAKVGWQCVEKSPELCLSSVGAVIGESTRLPPMWPGFDSQTQRHMWVEFVGSLLCTRGGFSRVL